MQMKRAVLSAFHRVFPYEVTVLLSELWKIICQIVLTGNFVLFTYCFTALVKCLNGKAQYAWYTSGA